MNYHVKLVKGSKDERFRTTLADKKELVTLSVGLTKKELTQMKALSGLKGNVTDPQIVREYLKSKIRYGW